jgi:hypothetical protein
VNSTPPRSPRLRRRALRSGLVALALVLGPLGQAAPEAVNGSTSAWDITDLIDHLPDFSGLGLPGLSQNSPFRFYVQPHFGDLLHRDYLRVPVGVRFKPGKDLEFHTELEGYFTHGLGDNSAGYGFSRLRVGVKHDQIMSALHFQGVSAGVDFDTPLSRPPMELTDGHRHTLPYVAYTKSLFPEWHLVGYTGAGVDLLSHTALPANFGKNELHSNSLNMAAGVTRDWKRIRVTLTATYQTTALMSDESHHVFAIRPDFLIPLTRHPEATDRTHLLFTVGARSVWGPDGQELGVSSSLRIEFARKPTR